MSGMRELIAETVFKTPVTDIHTHLFAPEMSGLLLSGADHMLSYHYLIAEAFRVHRLPYEEFWGLDQSQQAELIWKSLFEGLSPLSEASQGLLRSAHALGYDGEKNLARLRLALSDVPSQPYVKKVLALSGVSSLVMTNDPFNPDEVRFWATKHEPVMTEFKASLRLDPLVNSPPDAMCFLREQGYDVEDTLGDTTQQELFRFLSDWRERINPLYLAISTSGAFRYGDGGWTTRLLDAVLLPWCRDQNMPLSLMIGVRRQLNPELKDAGDGLADSSLEGVVALCQQWTQNKFLLTALSREAQYPLTVAARKFSNLMIFGAWWFLNTRSLLREITQMRLELLGSTFVMQHSDARVLEQLIYKWHLAREVLVEVLTQRYQALTDVGWKVGRVEIERDVGHLLHQGFWQFIGRDPTL